MSKKLYDILAEDEEVVNEEKAGVNETEIQEKKETKSLSELNPELFEKIKEIALTENVKKEKEVFFSKKGKVNLIINNHSLKPSNLCLVNRSKFKELYLKELEESIYSDKEDNGRILGIIQIFKFIQEKKYPINVCFRGFTSIEKEIIYVLNNFYNTHYNVIRSIYTMFKGVYDKTEKE